jgi:hypothetical protein
LAAVIAAFVFGMAGNIQKTKVVAVTVHKISQTDITVMNQGGQDQASLIALNATANSQSGTLSGCLLNGVALTATGGKCRTTETSVGTSLTLRTSGTWSGQTHVTVVGEFNDGSSQILMDTYI